VRKSAIARLPSIFLADLIVLSFVAVATPTNGRAIAPAAFATDGAAFGGSGGDIYHVTNLDDSGPGSLRSGIQTAVGPRTIVFDVAGTIELRSRLPIDRPYLTLAGDTAPDAGITVTGWTTSVANTHDVVVRHLRFRPGDANCPAFQDDALNVVRSTDVLIDHVSTSWSIDETLSVTYSDRVTVQWSIIAESLNDSCHEKGSHGYASLLRWNGDVAFHHNLFTHHNSRVPRVGDDTSLNFVNNVLYDWGMRPGYSGPEGEGSTRINYVGNYAIAGPSTTPSRRSIVFVGGSPETQIYQQGNLIDANLNGYRDGTDTGWAMFAGSYTPAPTRFDFPPVAADDADATYERVLAEAGASPARDSVDERIVEDVRTESGRIIDRH
jgi:pectate lyase